MKVAKVGLAILYGDRGYFGGRLLDNVDDGRLTAFARFLNSHDVGDLEVEIDFESRPLSTHIADALEHEVALYDFDPGTTKIITEGLWALRSARCVISTSANMPEYLRSTTPIRPVSMRRRSTYPKYPFKDEHDPIVRSTRKRV